MVELANEQQSEVIRQQAGLYIKVQLSAEEESIRQQKLLQWAALDDAVKAQIKAGSMQVSLVCILGFFFFFFSFFVIIITLLLNS